MRTLQSVLAGLVLTCLTCLPLVAQDDAGNPREQYKELLQKNRQLNGKLSGARRKVLKESPEVAELRKKMEEAKQAYDEAMREQLMKDPEAAPIVKELDEVRQKMNDLREQMKKNRAKRAKNRPKRNNGD